MEQWIKYLQVMQQSDKNEEVTVDLTFWRGKKRGINAKTHIRGTQHGLSIWVTFEVVISCDNIRVKSQTTVILQYAIL